MLAICRSLSIFWQTCSQFLNLSGCPGGRPALKGPALRTGQDEKIFLDQHQDRSGQCSSGQQDRAGQKKVPCDGL
jgi:hypothetical protein